MHRPSATPFLTPFATLWVSTRKLATSIALACLVMWPVHAQSFHFIALGDLPYGPASQSYPPYRQLIDRINQEAGAFSIHVGDIKSGSTLCNDEEFTQQLEHFARFKGAVVYTPGDNEWTDCHRLNNGGFDPLERLAALRQRFFQVGRSLGQAPIAVENQSAVTLQRAKFIENQRWHHQGVTFATLHIVGSNNNLEARSPSAALEFFERDGANIEWLQSTFNSATEKGSRAVVIAFQADVFDSRSPYEDFPGSSGFKRSVEGTLLPLAERWGKPVLVIHGDSHQFRVDQPFSLQKRPLRNVTRLIVPGASDVRAVRVDVRPSGSFSFELIEAR
jgi:hypothetical protein